MIGNFKEKRIRSETHLKFIRSLPCVECGNQYGIHAHHIRLGTVCGTGIKPNDSETLSLCGVCHHHLHTYGEKSFWGSREPLKLAEYLYMCFRKYGEQERRIRALTAITKWKCNGKRNKDSQE